MICEVCGVDVERTVNVNFKDNPIPEKWCLSCLRKTEYGEDYTNDDNADIGWYPDN